jgi:hypothetical protein
VVPSDTRAALAEHPGVLVRGERRVGVRVEGGVVLELEDRGLASLGPIRVGLTVDGIDLSADVRLGRVTRRTVSGDWVARSGKATGPHSYSHDELVVELDRHDGLGWELHVRLADDGFAFRAVMPVLAGHHRLDSDDTVVPLPANGRAWVLDYQTWYETPRFGAEVAELAGDYGFPVLVRLGGEGDSRHALVTEAAIDGRFSGAHPRIHGGDLRLALADAAVELVRGPVTPWRVVLLGGLDDIVASQLVDELAPAAPADRAGEWVRPGRAAWSWWSDFYSGAQLEQQKHFVDVAARFGWEHLLIDCGWEETWVPEIVAYASLRGIQVHLWTVWHDLDGPEKLGRLALWRSWGVAGIKVDFMESESKDRYRWYDAVLAETSRLGLMVNFHGSVIPRGWARTWPHVVGYEAIRGSEYYVFYNDTPLTAAHNVIQPFTRNVVGAMDYTPVAFGAPGRATSDGHELALAVAFECGITNFADSVDAYLSRPAAARLLSELAPAWDETVLLAGTPDTEAVIARRSGDRWFLGGIATGDARSLSIPLDRLGLGSALAWVVGDALDADGEPGRGLTHREQQLAAGQPLEVALDRDGGFAAILVAEGATLFRAAPRTAAPAPRVPTSLVELVDGAAELLVDPAARLRVPPGWRTEQLGGGRHRLVADPALAPGHLGVVAVEEDGTEGVPRIAHVRVIQPLEEGTVVLSTLPMLAFENQFGPAERDQSNGGGNPGDGLRQHVAGESYDDGFGVSTPSRVDLHLGGRASRLRVEVGVDDETPATSATARVLGDGVELARAELFAGRAATPLDVDVTGVGILTLVTEPVDPAAEPAHVDWASGRLDVAPADLHTTPNPGR